RESRFGRRNAPSKACQSSPLLGEAFRPWGRKASCLPHGPYSSLDARAGAREDASRQTESPGIARESGGMRMNRYITGWILIFIGVAGIVNAIAMPYFFNQAAEAEKAQARTDLNGGPLGNSGRSDGLLRYGSAAVSGVVGLVLMCWGVGLRNSG